MKASGGEDFDEYVIQCRSLMAAGIAPADVHWTDRFSNQDDLFGEQPANNPQASAPSTFRVPKALRDLAKTVYYHRSSDRLHLIYTAIWRQVNGEKALLEKLTDPVIHRLFEMRKQVTRDAHKMKAFVRFRQEVREGVEWYIAWHEPDHRIVRYLASFFRERFGPMNWSIFTPDESMHWNQLELTFSQGVSHNPVREDKMEELWQTYYASVFNPARLKIKAMKTEMPVRYWKSMPETVLIPDLIAASQDRTSAMITVDGLTARDFLPTDPTIDTIRTAANTCRGCPLYHGTTQAVCSAGPPSSRFVLVGEQPGDQEDLSGKPFVGPAGQVLDQALHEAGIDRELLYITEAVKHFKHEFRNGRRYHRSPSASDVAACRPWLIEEMRLVQPEVLVCLGTNAAHSVVGRQVTLKEMRGKILETPMCSHTIVTAHPAAVLRQPNPDEQKALFAMLVADLRSAAELALLSKLN